MTIQLTEPLANLPRTPYNHFRLHLLAAAYSVINELRIQAREREIGIGHVLATFPFLETDYLQTMGPYMPVDIAWEDAILWWPAAIAAWEHDAPPDLPLRSLKLQLGLTHFHLMSLLLAGLVDEDPRFGPVFAHLETGNQRPGLQLLAHLSTGPGNPEAPDGWTLPQALIAAGLLEVADRDVPRSEWAAFVPSVLWEVLAGVVEPGELSEYTWIPPRDLAVTDDLILPPEVLSQIRQIPALVQQGLVRTIVLRSVPGNNPAEVMGALARAMGCGVILVEAAPTAQPHLGPLCTLTRSLPVLEYHLGPGETAELSELPGYKGPVGALLGLEGGLRGKLAERAVIIDLPLPGPDLRKRYWEKALEGYTAEDPESISERLLLPGGHIQVIGELAVARAALDQRSTVRLSDVREAARSLNRQMLDNLATRLEARGSWDDLVVSEGTLTKLKEVAMRCRHRERLMERLSPAYAHSGTRGVRALFSGPSGTGKTLGAKILAAVLEMDLYRVDLAAVMNKYIGETEKNLSQILSRAEELDVILLLDEGDSLMSKRSDVKSSNDRYANLQTNYLLQRLEYYQGIVLVTTNSAANIDSAFQRRMDVVVPFLSPQAEERLRIWKLHLPKENAVSDAQVEEVAGRCLLSGGQIRNAALHATLLALDSRTAVTYAHLTEAIRSEYKKAGAVSPLT